MNQVELERSMSTDGAALMLQRIEERERHGRGDDNPYASALYRKYLFPLAERIAASCKSTGKAGRRSAHVGLLRPLDEHTVALLAIRETIRHLTSDVEHSMIQITALARTIGRTIQSELILSAFSEEEPELFWELYDDLSRRHSRDERHRRVVFQMQAEKAGVDVAALDWGIGGREQVGCYLLQELEEMGFITIERHTLIQRNKPIVGYVVSMADEAANLVDSITDRVCELSPLRLPFVEQPKDWTTMFDGGYHTPEMHRTLMSCVRTSAFGIAEIKKYDIGATLSGLNSLQHVKWRINERVLQIVTNIAMSGREDIGDLFVEFTSERPERPDFLDTTAKEDFTDYQLAIFKAWKTKVRKWHEENNDRVKQQRRTKAALRVASQFKDESTLYFLYQADFRSRMYAMSRGVNPQGSDLQKALIEFKDAEPVDDPDAILWFKVAGASRYGVDKVPRREQAEWVDRNHEAILMLVRDPTAGDALDWLSAADKPMQFLAWALEYADWVAFPKTFVSRQPVGQDGSCNGLQNFSAMLRDEVGGKATNLVPADRPQDIYASVAKRTEERLQERVEDDQEREQLRVRWLQHGLTRGLVKRSVMTLPYGSTRFSCSNSILDEYLTPGNADDVFTKEEHKAAAQYLSFIVWEAIADVVVKAREAMDYLQAAVRPILDRGEDKIVWVTPNGFPVVQCYTTDEVHRINTLIGGKSKLVVKAKTDKPDGRHHKSGIAPNFIHSMDATHMARVAVAANAAGIESLAMIHDDFGTHAKHSQKLYEIIRTEFIRIYTESAPIEEFAKRYGLPFTIEKGNLDINDVAKSEYFFG